MGDRLQQTRLTPGRSQERVLHELPEESLGRFRRVEKLLRTQRSLPAKLETVVAMARRTVPNCDAAGISLILDG